MALMAVGGAAGSLPSGVLSDFAGRKPTVILGGSLVSLGGVLHLAAVNLW